MDDDFDVVRVPLWRKLVIAGLILGLLIAIAIIFLGPGMSRKAQQQQYLEQFEQNFDNKPKTGP